MKSTKRSPQRRDLKGRISDEESELSSVIDDEPKPKPKPKRKLAHPKGGEGARKKSRAKDEKLSEQDTVEEEVKRLKACLVKCGVRKMWYRELQHCDTSQAKVRHLKQMLSDVGMTGRFSAEKANQIREARELQADLEAVQQGARKWGKSEDEASEEESPERVRPRRRVARGLEGLDFLDDDDDEESN